MNICWRAITQHWAYNIHRSVWVITVVYYSWPLGMHHSSGIINSTPAAHLAESQTYIHFSKFVLRFLETNLFRYISKQNILRLQKTTYYSQNINWTLTTRLLQLLSLTELERPCFPHAALSPRLYFCCSW